MKIIYTKHAKDKLLEQETKKLGLTKKHLISVLKEPIIEDKVIDPYQSVGKFSESLSLSVIWKIENGIVKVITFYPASKARYESKILQGR